MGAPGIGLFQQAAKPQLEFLNVLGHLSSIPSSSLNTNANQQKLNHCSTYLKNLTRHKKETP